MKLGECRKEFPKKDAQLIEVVSMIYEHPMTCFSCCCVVIGGLVRTMVRTIPLMYFVIY